MSSLTEYSIVGTFATTLLVGIVIIIRNAIKIRGTSNFLRRKKNSIKLDTHDTANRDSISEMSHSISKQELKAG